MAVGDKRPVLMEADKGMPNGVPALDGAGKVERENLNVEYIKNINPTTTGCASLLEYMASRYDEHPVIFGSMSGFSDLPTEATSGQATINLCGGILTITLVTRTEVWYRGTNSLSSWTANWRKGYDSNNLTELRDALKAIW